MSRYALITGAARRIGAVTAASLHQQGYTVFLHYHRSTQEAKNLAAQLNSQRADSAFLISADLLDRESVASIGQAIEQHTSSLDLLVNNASQFYPTNFDQATQQNWDELIDSNLRTPFFLSQRLQPLLKNAHGSIVNIIDIHAERMLEGYPIYSIAKAGLAAATKSLAKELAPEIRVNGVSPGPILWPEQEAALSKQEQQAVIEKTLLDRCGQPKDIAQAISYLAEARYVTGQILAVDGGKSLYS